MQKFREKKDSSNDTYNFLYDIIFHSGRSPLSIRMIHLKANVRLAVTNVLLISMYEMEKRNRGTIMVIIRSNSSNHTSKETQFHKNKNQMKQQTEGKKLLKPWDKF